MQAIQTRYHGPTDSIGSRVTARCAAGRLTVGWDHALDVFENHLKAAQALCAKLGWDGELASGSLVDGSYVHVFTGK